jgi:hypothetical protein
LVEAMLLGELIEYSNQKREMSSPGFHRSQESPVDTSCGTGDRSAEWLGAHHEAIVTTRAGIMDVQVTYVFPCKEAPNAALKFTAVDDFRANHHGLLVVRANGQKTMLEHGWNCAWRRIRRCRILPHKDWPGRSIRRRYVVMGIRKKYDGLSNFSVGEADPTWEARLLIDNHSASPRRQQVSVALVEERQELSGRQTDELKRRFHCLSLWIAKASRTELSCRRQQAQRAAWL